MFVALHCEEYPEGDGVIPEISHVLILDINTNATIYILCNLIWIYMENLRRLEIIR